MNKPIFLSLALALTGACSKSPAPENPDPTDLQTYGSGDYTYTWSPQLADRPVQVYYHIPAQAHSGSPVLLVFHGAGRDAEPSRNDLRELADEKGFVLLVPEFSDQYYPGSNLYNLGGVFVNGESPSLAGLLPEDRWTFSIVEPLFADARSRFRFDAQKFDAFGHSAGAQFLHRLLLFKPDLPLDRAVSNAAGWYTLPDTTIEYPYGMGTTNYSVSSIARIFSKDLRVSVGALDTDPNSFDLRHTPEADAQGNTRLERAQYFYQTGAQLAQPTGVPFRWRYSVWPSVGHDFQASAEFALQILYP